MKPSPENAAGAGDGDGYGDGGEEGEDDGDEGAGVDEVDVPFELVGKVASAGAVAEARHVERSATARHCDAVVGTIYVI